MCVSYEFLLLTTFILQYERNSLIFTRLLNLQICLKWSISRDTVLSLLLAYIQVSHFFVHMAIVGVAALHAGGRGPKYLLGMR